MNCSIFQPAAAATRWLIHQNWHATEAKVETKSGRSWCWRLESVGRPGCEHAMFELLTTDSWLAKHVCVACDIEPTTAGPWEKHYVLRQVRRDQDDIVRQRMADALINDPSRSFWSEVKRIRNSNTGTSVVVDGCSDKAKIFQVFLRKYREL